MASIKCGCGKVIFDGVTLLTRVAQFGRGHFNVKCPRCRQWAEGLDIRILTGEVDTDISFQERRNTLDAY